MRVSSINPKISNQSFKAKLTIDKDLKVAAYAYAAAREKSDKLSERIGIIKKLGPDAQVEVRRWDNKIVAGLDLYPNDPNGKVYIYTVNEEKEHSVGRAVYDGLSNICERLTRKFSS